LWAVAPWVTRAAVRPARIARALGQAPMGQNVTSEAEKAELVVGLGARARLA